MYEDSAHPVNVPPLRRWDLNSESSRYDKLVAAPSDKDRVMMWTLWAILALLAVAPIITAFVGILSNRKVRSSPFNQYLLFLMVPDIVYTGSCAVTCILNAIEGHFVGEFGCYYQSWYAMFGVSGSAWMNVLMAREIYRMLNFGNNYRRYQSPTTRQIARDSIIILTLAAFVSSWSIWRVSWMPHETVLLNGIGCFPQDFDLATTLFFYLFFFPALLAIPLACVVYMGYQIWSKDMLPKQGRRRMLAVFFTRLVAIYVLMWLPTLLLVSVFNNAFTSPWIFFVGGAWGHMQGAVSAIFILSKPDTKQAVKDLCCPRCCLSDDNKQESLPQSATSSGAHNPLDTNTSQTSSARFWLTPSRLRLSITSLPPPPGQSPPPETTEDVLKQTSITSVTSADSCGLDTHRIPKDTPNEENSNNVQDDDGDDNSDRLGTGFELPSGDFQEEDLASFVEEEP